MIELTKFGYKSVTKEEKTLLVGGVFASVADKYDLMNDLMSLGLHRIWKRFTLEVAGIRPNMDILDLACGSGDLLLAMAKKQKKQGKLFGVDPSTKMLEQAQKRIADSGLHGYIELIEATAEALPVEPESFDLITCSFGFRNTTDKIQSLQSCLQALRTGGRLLILEFSHPQSTALSRLYDTYSFRFLPLLGELVANDRESYQYLVESIRTHPNQITLKQMLEKVGFVMVNYTNLNGGVVALHSGYKI